MPHDYHLVKLFFLYISEDSEHTAKIKQSKKDQTWNVKIPVSLIKMALEAKIQKSRTCRASSLESEL